MGVSMHHEVYEIVKEGLKKHSYHASHECINEIAENIVEAYEEDVELAWQYRDLSE